MFITIIIAVIIFIVYSKNHYSDSEGVTRSIKGRNENQKAVIRYFCNEESCLSKSPISDGEYTRLVQKVLDNDNHFNEEYALNKLGIDIDQVKEIDPVQLYGYNYDNPCLAKPGKDGKWRSSKYQVTWLFFSATQLYVYQKTFHMDTDEQEENTREYFYKDVTSINIKNETIEVENMKNTKNNKDIRTKNDVDSLWIAIPGDGFGCALQKNEDVMRSIQGMKSLLREKKNA